MHGNGFHRLVDPRGRLEHREIKLAPRVSKDTLKSEKIVFYNNTKLGFCNYGTIFTRIKERFAELGISDFADFIETVRGKSTEELQNYAKKLAEVKPAAAIIALGDMGTSPATTIVTAAMEELGIPSVYITAPPGADLVKGVAYYRAGSLCLCPLDIYQGSTVEDIIAEVDKKFDYIINSLTLPPDKIKEHAHVGYELDQEPQGEGQTIPVPENIAVRLTEEKGEEPGSYIEEFMDLADFYHIGDGLPLVPPTKRRVQNMLSYCPFKPDTVLAKEIGPTGKDITVGGIAVSAVMAGCRPRHMPILITAFKAMGDIRYNFLQSVTTSHPGGNLVLVSGPLAEELGIHGGQGCIGPGFTPNATIGRAVNLAIINICRSVPGYCDLDCIASQAEYTYCFSEDPVLTPWDTINAERYDENTTTVYVLKAEPPHDIIDFLSLTAGDLLDTYVGSATTLGSNNAYIPGPMVFVITPDHSRLLHREGYTKNMIRQHIHERAHHEAPMVRNRGLRPVRPEGFDQMHPIPVTRSPEDIEIVVAGGRGGHSSVILPWALHSEEIVEPVLLPGGEVPKSIEDFKRQ